MNSVPVPTVRRRLVAIAATLVVAALLFPATGVAPAEADTSAKYVVLLNGDQTDSGFVAASDTQAALAAISSLGGVVTNDLSSQIGALVVDAGLVTFEEQLRATGLVAEVAEDYRWKAYKNYSRLVATGELDTIEPSGGPDNDPDVLESQQWGMSMIRVHQAHEVQAGSPAVTVGVLDTGIDGAHADFISNETLTSNVDCANGRDSVSFGPGIGTPAPCVDNNFHGTHVAGIIAARANVIGVVGVAPNVTLVPVKVCDAEGFCYFSAVVDGLTYAGDQRFNVINMSFFVDDDEFEESTEFKCMDDPQQRAFRIGVHRAMQYARGNGVTPVAALGNSETDLAEDDKCNVIPAESTGVIGVTALGNDSTLSFYSNWGSGAADVSAPGGSGTTGDPTTTILSTFPGNTYAAIQGTSMASPHAAGVAALIVSQYGQLTSSGDVRLSPGTVADILQSTATDIGASGYDELYGHGRVDALSAVTN